MLLAKGIEPAEIEVEEDIMDASQTGRYYAVSGGVAQAVEKRIHEIDPDAVVEMENAEGLHDCVTLARMAKLGKMNGKLIEGMACTGGCVGGPGTVVDIRKSSKAVKDFSVASIFKSPADNTNIPVEDRPDDSVLQK